MPHLPAHHIIDDVFDPAQTNAGPTPPTRNVGAAATTAPVALTNAGAASTNTLVLHAAGLRLRNFDRGDPTNYQVGDLLRPNNLMAEHRPPLYRRGVLIRAAGTNWFQLTKTPTMPAIRVEVECIGFDPAVTPIRFRLQTKHVHCRFQKTQPYRYESTMESPTGEWQGQARAGTFTLFDTNDTNVTYTFNTADGSTTGGHAILSVAVQPPGTTSWLIDYAHLLIVGNNPGETEVRTAVTNIFAGRNDNIRQMVLAAFAHEAAFEQFKDRPQGPLSMTFQQRHHNNDATQPNCTVRFVWPEDPPYYPKIAYDYGVGISQFTKLPGQVVTPGILWNWQENIIQAINLFLNKLNGTWRAGSTWRAWALRAWERNNGSGPQAVRYAQTLEANADGQQVEQTAIPATYNRRADLATLPSVVRNPGAAPAWPA